MLQCASRRNDAKPERLISPLMTAHERGGPTGWAPWQKRPFETSKEVVWPALTPPIFRSPPLVRPNALSNAILIVLPVFSCLVAPVSTTAAAQAPTTNS